MRGQSSSRVYPDGASFLLTCLPTLCYNCAKGWGERQRVELTPKQQTLGLIKSSQDILVTCHKSTDGDALGSSLALGSALKTLGKNITIVCSDEVSAQFSYIPDIGIIQKTLTGSRDFIISIDTTKSSDGEI